MKQVAAKLQTSAQPIFSRETYLDGKDVGTFKNLVKWVSEKETLFVEKVLNEKGLNRFNFEFEVVCNQVSFILFLNGQVDEAANLCNCVIRRYLDLYTQYGDFSYLGKVIQPLINVSRLYRLLGQGRQASLVFQGINALERDVLQIEEHRFKLTDLNPEIQNVLLFNSAAEPLKLLVKESQWEKVLAYLNKTSLKHNLHSREVEILALMGLERYEAASDHILTSMKVSDGVQRFKFYLRLIELMNVASDSEKAVGLLENLINILHSEMTGFKWKDLLFVNRVVELAYELLEESSVIPFHLHLIRCYRACDDEFNTLKQLHILEQKSANEVLNFLGEPLMHSIQSSDYASLRKIYALKNSQILTLNILTEKIKDMVHS